MSKTYKIIRLAGTSDKSHADAIQSAIDDAHHSLNGLNWFEVREQRGRIDEETGRVVEWQVVMDVGFKIKRD